MKGTERAFKGYNVSSVIAIGVSVSSQVQMIPGLVKSQALLEQTQSHDLHASRLYGVNTACDGVRVTRTCMQNVVVECLYIVPVVDSLTNDESRRNWEIHGNPDGPRGK